MAIGRPLTLTPNVATKNISVTATSGQTSFTPTGGYRINELGVYRNGTRLVDGKDFTAIDGVTVTLLSGATVGDVIEFQIFDSFNIADAISADGNQTINGNLQVGSAITMYSASGIVSATQFIGDGSLLTGVSAGKFSSNDTGINTTTSVGIGTTNAEGAADTNNSKVLNVGVVTANNLYGTLTGNVTGNVTGNASGSSGSCSGNAATATLATNASGLSGSPDITINNLVGVAATFSGVLTYEDVTSVDSIGIITARKGVVVSSGSSIGIGTAEPDNELHVFGATTAAIRIETGDGGYNPIVMQENPDRTWHTGLRGDASDSWVVRDATAGSNRLVIDTIGEVKVGSAFSVGQAGVVTAAYYYGDGQHLSNLPAAGIGTLASSPAANTIVTLDLGTYQHHELTLTAGFTTITSSGGVFGDSHSVVIIQPASGIATVGFSTYFLWPSASAPTMSEGLSKVDLISFVVKNNNAALGITTELLASVGLNYS